MSAPVAQEQPAAAPTTTTTTATHPAGKSDVDHWVERASAAARDPSGITHPTGTAPWNTSLFDCFNPIDTCAITCCCPCITFGKTHHRLHKDANLAGYSAVNPTCLVWWGVACFGLHCIPNLLQRHDIRTRATPELSGNFATDFLRSWCCNCCDLIQQDKEAEHLLSVNAAAGVVSQPAKTEAMTYAPQ